jgi:hypothetical protein
MVDRHYTVTYGPTLCVFKLSGFVVEDEHLGVIKTLFGFELHTGRSGRNDVFLLLQQI